MGVAAAGWPSRWCPISCQAPWAQTTHTNSRSRPTAPFRSPEPLWIPRSTHLYPGSGIHSFITEESGRPVSFPDDARGFLHLHAPAAEPTAMWEIRFRVTDSDCPSSFKAGSDLVYPNGTTWAIALGSLHPRNREYLPLRDLLIREGVDVDALLDKMGVTKIKKANSRPQIDSSLAQRFRVDFQSTSIHAVFISFSGEQMQCAVKNMFTIGQSPEHRLSPYSGLSLVPLRKICISR
ncbi:hypothetical protein FIBSPDRAFT_208412 [Athelia psychrophila]|uniref:Uncharacterized protein n=1 Tax=Athelia psychrophila TaxID=1759441 RepID=A0A166WMN2_9AGAM|nr:hypothetical protein FIBSPDRAFT_208412 [Fibularhizoctonia sp. CBS 109695]